MRYTTHHWKNTDKKCYWYDDNNLYYTNLYGHDYGIFRDYNWAYNDSLYLYPKSDLTSIETNFKTKKINPDSKLYFDQGSGFPRFKLGLSSAKRCIKTTKADYIVTSGDTNYDYSPQEYVVIETDDEIRFITKNDWNEKYRGNLTSLIKATSPYVIWNNPNIIFCGFVYGFTKESAYLAKYSNGEYTLPYITDKDLDKMIGEVCPEPTYEEIESIVDMLNSEDAATVQLGVKMIQGYNVDKYKMTLRLILCTRDNWYVFTRNTVGTKQLLETLDLDKYKITNTFSYGCRYAYIEGESYTAEDIALSKRLAKKLITDDFQRTYKENFLNQQYPWLPDERKIVLE